MAAGRRGRIRCAYWLLLEEWPGRIFYWLCGVFTSGLKNKTCDLSELALAFDVPRTDASREG